MNRGVTNTIRAIMDEGLPPFIRDRRWFMYPFFWYWFKGKNIPLYMDFKKRVGSMSAAEFADCYRELDCRATDRATDINKKCIAHMLAKIDPAASSLLDVGCGRGFWLTKLQEHTKMQLSACDLYDESPVANINYTRGNIEDLPYPDRSFDIVTCHHTIEHVRDLQKAVDELKRVARRQLMIVVPKQRYYYYTLDLHLHFFHKKEYLTRLFGLKSFECRDLGGDWCYIATLTDDH